MIRCLWRAVLVATWAAGVACVCGLSADIASEDEDAVVFFPLIPRMSTAEKELAHGNTGQETRAIQHEIVAMMDSLIAALEKQQGAASATGTGQQAAQEGTAGRPGPPSAEAKGRPADESFMPTGQWEGEIEGAEASAQGAWAGALPPLERQKVEQAFKEARLPARYLQLIEQYSLSLAGEER